MIDAIRERIISALQRDRLSGFLKESQEAGSGCFYLALISAHNYLYPDVVLDRKVDQALREAAKNGYGVKPSELVGETRRLEPQLGLDIGRVVSLATQSESEIREMFKFPNDIPVVRNNGQSNFTAVAGTSTEIIYLQRNDKESAHWIHVAENPRFQGDEIPMGKLGGQAEFDAVKDKYQPVLVFHIVKSGRFK